MQIISRLRKTLDVELPLQIIFDAPTVAELAESIEKNSRKELHSITEKLELVERLSEDEIKTLLSDRAGYLGDVG